jgi:hypothetical protein
LESVAEINVGIICACIPLLNPLFNSCTTKLKWTGSPFKNYIQKYRGLSDATNARKHTGDAIGRLPTITQGRMSILLPFFGGRKTIKTEILRFDKSMTYAAQLEMVPHSELSSIDLDYHSHLVTE